MRIRIHRGTREIGGTCVEVEASSGDRILLDLGMPLNAENEDDVTLPAVPGLLTPDPSLRAIVLSHGHRDYWGLLPKLQVPVPVVMGAATERIMRAAAQFVPDGYAPKAEAHLISEDPLPIGPFVITPRLVDHSGFDAYSLVVEADNSRLLYSGDLRAHGRKDALFEGLLRRPPRHIDLMLLEGSSIGRIADDAKFPSESDIEHQLRLLFKETAGLALVACSAQNIDRVVSVYRAARRSGRILLVDAYAAAVLKATEHPSIPKPADDWKDVQVFIPQRQRVMLVRSGIAAIVDEYKGRRVWPQNLAANPQRYVLLARGWMLEELEQIGALSGAHAVWSQWDGYLEDGQGAAFKRRCAELGLPFETIHTSGHASPPDLIRLAEAVNPKRLAAIHTFQRDRYPDLFKNVVHIDDGQWIEVIQ